MVQRSAGDDRREMQHLCVSLLLSCKDIFESCLLLVESSATISEKEIHLKNTVESLSSMHLIVRQSVASDIPGRQSGLTEKLQSATQVHVHLLCMAQNMKSAMQTVRSKLALHFPMVSDPLNSPETRQLIGSFNLTAAKFLLDSTSSFPIRELQPLTSSLSQFYSSWPKCMYHSDPL